MQAVRRAAPAASPLPSVDETWMWTMASLRAREGMFARPEPRACRPKRIIACVERLHRTRKLTREHLHTMQHYGNRGHAPAGRFGLRLALWREGMQQLDRALRLEGIIGEVRRRSEAARTGGRLRSEGPGAAGVGRRRSQRPAVLRDHDGGAGLGSAGQDGSLVRPSRGAVSRASPTVRAGAAVSITRVNGSKADDPSPAHRPRQP